MTTGRELVRPEDVAAARDEVADFIARGETMAAERALAVYAPSTQALIVRATFEDAFMRARADGLAGIDATHCAAREAEEILEAIPGESASTATKEITDDVLGAMLGARAGDAHSSAAELVDPERIEEILAHVQELWTTEVEARINGPEEIIQISHGEERTWAWGDLADAEARAERGELGSRIPNISQLLKVFCTIFQTEDGRAREIFVRLPLDLLALPFADAFAKREATDVRAIEFDDLDRNVDLAEDEPIRHLQSDCDLRSRVKPFDIAFLDGTLMELRDRLRELSSERCEEVIIHAWEMVASDRVRVTLEDVAAEAEEQARGKEEAAPVAPADDMFAPLDPQDSGKGSAG